MVGREDRVGRAGVIVSPLPMLTHPGAMIRPSRYVIPSENSNDKDSLQKTLHILLSPRLKYNSTFLFSPLRY